MGNQNTFNGRVHNITRHGDLLIVLFKLPNGRYPRTYTSPKYRNYHHWTSLCDGDEVAGLQWFNEKKGLVNADSPIHISRHSLSNETTLLTA